MPTLEEIFSGLQEKHGKYRENIPALLESKNEDDVQSEAITRGEFRTDLQKVSNVLKDKVNDMESMRREIAQMKAEQKIDMDKLDAHKWELIHNRKTYGA